MDLTDSSPMHLHLADMREHMKDYEFRKANERRVKEGLPALTREEWRSHMQRRRMFSKKLP